MSFTDHFGNPKGLLGRMMLVSMDKEHLPMAQWALVQISIPDSGKVVDLYIVLKAVSFVGGG